MQIYSHYMEAILCSRLFVLVYYRTTVYICIGVGRGGGGGAGGGGGRGGGGGGAGSPNNLRGGEGSIPFGPPNNPPAFSFSFCVKLEKITNVPS